jgi:hypothetical protein
MNPSQGEISLPNSARDSHVRTKKRSPLPNRSQALPTKWITRATYFTCYPTEGWSRMSARRCIFRQLARRPKHWLRIWLGASLARNLGSWTTRSRRRKQNLSKKVPPRARPRWVPSEQSERRRGISFYYATLNEVEEAQRLLMEFKHFWGKLPLHFADQETSAGKIILTPVMRSIK